MRILFVSLDLNWPPTRGSDMRSWSLVEGLSDCGHQLTVLAFAGKPCAAPGFCRVLNPVPLAACSLSGSYAVGGRLRALLHGRPFSITRFASPLMRSRLAAAMAAGDFDAVVADSVHGAVNFPDPMPLPLIVNTHNLEFLLLQRYAAREWRPLHRAYAELEWRRLARWELDVWRRADLVLACSEHDRQGVADRAPSTPAAVVPNIVDTDRYLPPSEAEAGSILDPNAVLFTGGMDWLPNRDAVGHAVADILPRLRAHRPATRLWVAGRRGPRAWETRLTRTAGVERFRDVDDMRALIARAAVCIVPLRIGSGTRLKILEAGAMAKAIVSTRLGAEGLALQADRELLLADAPADFAAAVLSLLDDPARRWRLGAAARVCVQRRYSRTALVGALRYALALMAEGRQARSNLQLRAA